MTDIHPADPDRDREAVRDLFREYLLWANARLNEEYGIDFDVDAWVRRDSEIPPGYWPQWVFMELHLQERAHDAC